MSENASSNQALPWNDMNRFNQTGYSAPTIFPNPEDYKDINLYNVDLKLAEARETSHQEWKEDEKWDRIHNGRN